jgi:hypothetical protein
VSESRLRLGNASWRPSSSPNRYARFDQSESLRLKPNPEAAGRVLLTLALLFNAILFAPEALIERLPVNDLAFHIGAAQRLGQGVIHREPFLDPWVSQWSLGFPLWRAYQPLPHLIAAAVMGLFHPWASPAASFAALYYVLLVLLSLSVAKQWLSFSRSDSPSGRASFLRGRVFEWSRRERWRCTAERA